MTCLFEKRLMCDGHVRAFYIGREPGRGTGWESCEESDHRILQRHAHQDWHRVEHTRERFGRVIKELRQAGWRDA